MWTHLQYLSFPNPALDELGIQFAALLTVLEAQVEGRQLGVAGRSV